MKTLTNGTTYRPVPNGYVVTRGNRTLYLNGTSVTATEKAKNLIAMVSFNKLWDKATVASGIHFINLK